MNLNAKFITYNSDYQEFPKVNTQNVILVDGVINSGKTLLAGIKELEKKNPSINIFIATNVINKDALIKFAPYKLRAVRFSNNQFIGVNIHKQKGSIGPDTSDRLFNQLNDFIINELELSINNKCNLRCKECGFLTPNQPYPALGENIIEEHFNCLKIFEKNNIIIKSLGILGGEPTLDANHLEKAVLLFSSLKNIQQIEIITNGLFPSHFLKKTLSLIDKISISVYINDIDFINGWKKFINKSAPHIKLCFRIQKDWDVHWGDRIVSEQKAELMFKNCWYKKHCPTIERSRLFLCSIAAKRVSDNDGLLLDSNTSSSNIINYLSRKNQLSYCCKCIPQMNLPKVQSGQQASSFNLFKMIENAKSFLKNI